MNVRGSAPDVAPLSITIELDSVGKNITKSECAYRAFPDGHFEDFGKTQKFDSFQALLTSKTLVGWWHYFKNPTVLAAQGKLAMDPEMAPYLEGDGSVLYTPLTQADFLYVPTKYARDFEKAASLHAKYDIFLEVALSKIVDMIMQTTDAKSRNVPLCTSWLPKRGTDKIMHECKSYKKSFGFLHPWKIHSHGYKHWGETYDWLNEE